MGGVRHPIGPIVSERIVHIDSPAVVSKHKQRADEAIKGYQEKAELATAALNAMTAEKLVLEKKLADVPASLSPAASPKAREGAALAIGPDSKELERLKFQAVKLREELAAAYQIARSAQKAAPVIQYVDRPTVQFVDRVVIQEVIKPVMRNDRRWTALAAALALCVGGVIGHYLQTPTNLVCPRVDVPAQFEKKVQARK